MTEFSLGSIEVSLSPSERFAEFLQSRGMRLTQQRRALVELIFRQHDHFDADALVDELRQDKSGATKASPSTVYRTLKELVEAGLLRRMHLNGRAVYEHDYGYPQHDHLHDQRFEVEGLLFRASCAAEREKRGNEPAPRPTTLRGMGHAHPLSQTRRHPFASPE